MTQLAAAKFVESHGREGIGILEERAALAAELGHKLAAATWCAMAAAAARLLDQNPELAEAAIARSIAARQARAGMLRPNRGQNSTA